MDFRIADTFTSSLTKLTIEEQKQVKTTVFDLQINPSNPGHQLHKLDRSKDPNFWSARVGRDIRLIIHRTGNSFLICYVDHHDNAYAWAHKRKIETHPTTGAAQIVQIRETVREIEVHTYVEKPVVVPDPATSSTNINNHFFGLFQAASPAPITAEPAPKIFKNLSAETFLTYGVPSDWVDVVLDATQDDILEIAECLPAEAAEAVKTLASGGTPTVPEQLSTSDPFEHPDALRRFRTLSNVDELQAALNAPWDQWAIFLHPSQQDYVVRDFNGPARIAGSAGTGKTVVAVHRAVNLAKRHEGSQVLLTTFSPALASQLKTKVKRLVASNPRLREQLEIIDLDALAKRLYESNFGKFTLASAGQIESILTSASNSVPDHTFTVRFLLSEWHEVVDAWQISEWEQYRDVKRLGRKTRMSESQRAILWQIFAIALSELNRSNLLTPSTIFSRLAKLESTRKSPLFDFCVVDEAQDVSVLQLRFLAAIGNGRPNALFFAGDQGQRIFQFPFSWLNLGVDIRGRSKCLTVNYRTSHQIRLQADRLLGTSISDVDGVEEDRRGTISVFNGQPPIVIRAASTAEEITSGTQFIQNVLSLGIEPQELCVIVRSEAEFDRAIQTITNAKASYRILSEEEDALPGLVCLSTMHLAKGHEYKAVLIMACDDEVIPLQSRIESASDETALNEVYATERQLLYVAATRARDLLYISSGPHASVFLDDFEGK